MGRALAFRPIFFALVNAIRAHGRLEQANLARNQPSDSAGRWLALDKEAPMWLAIAILFLIGWLIGFIAFHVAVAAIHILLALFIIFLIIHFVRRARRAA